MMKNSNLLSKAEMKNVMGGGVPVSEVGDGGSCFLRCDQDSTSGTSVSDCSRATAEAGCGEDLSKTVCVCTPS